MIDKGNEVQGALRNKVKKGDRKCIVGRVLHVFPRFLFNRVLNRMTEEVFIENVTYEYRNEGDKGGSQAGIPGGSIPGRWSN